MGRDAQRARRQAVLPAAVGLVSVGCLLGLWEWAGHSSDSVIASILPPPSQFLSSVAQSDFKIGLGSQAESVYVSVLSTFARVFAGMALAFVAAILTGALLSLSRFATWSLGPILHLLAPIAPIAWIPTAIVVFGIGNTTAVFIVFMGVYFILTIATLAEIARVPPEFLTVAGNLGANAPQRWLWVVLPAILPGVFTLLRTNFIAAWMAVLVAEMVGLRDGLGAIIMMGRNLFNNDLIMFGMVVIGVSGFVVDKLLGFIARYLLWWRV
ncbi:nitrate ABC transporter permease [Burkholderia sp. WAC0059]|uniref:ABC transporter permease n=1 Tax=Burkholderia sp. WAC0059 TaxID=2066022 RepID=UPI000C7F2EA5|nr:ABC transporter permease subunit [Burkholderia sp. WAC0059]PLZ00625.1 nitrate ABC transporter permease [Burkholderia sp. WAC0059]